MKKIKNLTALVPLLQNWVTILAIMLITFSCKKTTTPSNTIDNLFTEKIENIKLNEPVLFSYANPTNTAFVDWTITPNNNFAIEKSGNYATVKFSVAGVYTAIAKVGNKQATYIVTVVNTAYNNIATGFSVTASKVVGIAQNEEVVFTANNTTSTNIIWTITSGINTVTVAPDTKSATISFKNGNTATVTATDGSISQSRTVFINDPTSNNSIDTVPFILGDKIFITPSVQTDAFGVKTLNLSAKTSYNYQCNTDKILSTTDNTNYAVSYGGVAMSSTICSSIAPATCINSFVNMAVGSHPFTINYENKTYTGTIDVSATSKFTFSFINNGLLNIYPTEVQ